MVMISKNSIKELTIIEKKIIYVKLCDLISDFDKPYNLCNIHKDEFGCLKCNGTHRIMDNSLCCNSCRHLGINGCTTKSLACKFYYCIIGCFPEDRHLTFDLEFIKSRKRLISGIISILKKYDIPFVNGRANFEESFNILKLNNQEENGYNL